MSIELAVFLALVGYKALSKLCETGKHRRMMYRKNKKKKTGGIVRGQFNTILRPGLSEDFYYPGKVFFVDDPTETIYDEAYWRAWRRKHKHEDDPG